MGRDHCNWCSDAHVDVLARRRTVLGGQHLNLKARNIGNARTDVVKDLLGPHPVVVVDELDLEVADRIGRHGAHGARRAELHDDVLDAHDIEQFVLDLDQHVADFLRRVIAARNDRHGRVFRFGRGESLDARRVGGIGKEHPENDAEASQQGQDRMMQEF